MSIKLIKKIIVLVFVIDIALGILIFWRAGFGAGVVSVAVLFWINIIFYITIIKMERKKKWTNLKK
ncbi:MAG: hypothetical protein LBC07_04170 [Elusimicrobiota bacterium]|jgi:fatty acid desaturase|nr:hypothetical protein [Elusimicrobiota bacterium]